jgi:hypothetical protein
MVKKVLPNDLVVVPHQARAQLTADVVPFDFIESHYAALRSLALRLRQYLRIASEIFLDFSAAAALLSFFISSLSCSLAGAPFARQAL